MSAELLLREFERIGDAPDAMVRLRRFVLDLAVRGKLTDQRATDEPASALVSVLSLARTTFRTPQYAQPWSNGDTPFAIPTSWEWVRLDEAFDYDAGEKVPAERLKPDGWLVDLEDIESDTGTVLSHVTVGDRESLSTKSAFEPGDVLYGKLRPYLNKVVVANESGYSTTEIVAIRSFIPMCPEYTCLALRRPDFVDYVTRLGQGTKMPRLRTQDALAAPFPLPPLDEQRRIVAIVDELMALCDQLEMAQKERELQRDALRSVSLYQLTSTDGDKASTADVRLFLDKSPRLITKAEHVKEVRQMVLDLAARGRLVAQDPDEESAESVLHQAIALPLSEQRRRKILRKTPRASTNDLDLPLGWSARTVQELYDLNVIVNYADGNHGALYPRKNEFGQDGVLFVSAKDIAHGRVEWTSCARLNDARAKQLVKGWAKGGDVLLTHNATVGRVARVEPEIDSFLLGTSVTYYRLNSEALNPNYFYLYLLSSSWQEQLRAIMAQTTRNQVSIQKQAEFLVRIPPVVEQERIVARSEVLMTVCDELEEALASAQCDRGRLLEALLDDALPRQWLNDGLDRYGNRVGLASARRSHERPRARSRAHFAGSWLTDQQPPGG